MPMSEQRARVGGAVARIEWENLQHNTTAVILLRDGRVLRIHPLGLAQSEQNLLVLTRDGDEIEVEVADSPEPHVCNFSNRSIAGAAQAVA